MKRTKMVQVIKGGKSIDERIKEALDQYEISEDSLIEVKISGEDEGRTTALIVYDPDLRTLKGKKDN